MYSRKAVIAETGIDWLTATVERNSSEWGYVTGKAERELLQHKSEGNILKEGTMYGYSGFRAGANFMGHKDDRTLIQFTSGRAALAFERTYSEALHYSRLDIQATVRYDQSYLDIANYAYTHAEAANGALPPARRRKLQIIENNDGGSTCYIGSRNSEQFARIYNKDAESGLDHYKDCWRFEIVLRNELATKAAKSFFWLDERREVAMQQFVHDWLSQRGVTNAYPAPGEVVVMPTVQISKSDNQRKLEWLASQVAPTVRHLITSGLGDRMLIALGLPGELLELWNE